jgi:DNA sulfur modification protein DndE
MLKGKTGITPNILCRIGFCLSLNDPTVPKPQNYDENGLELNRFTLTGEYDKLFIALLKERLIKDGLDLKKDLFSQLRAHVNRGSVLLYDRVKKLEDFQDLLPKRESLA